MTATDEPDETPATPAELKARRVEAFAAHGPRYTRLAEALLGTDDDVFALAHLVVDHEARLDTAMDRIAALEFQLGQLKETQ